MTNDTIQDTMGTNETTKLSPRELEILKLVVEGNSNKEIANILTISANTVKVHLGKIFQKLNVGSRTEAVHVAIQQGLILLNSKAEDINSAKNTPTNDGSLRKKLSATRFLLIVTTLFIVVLVPTSLLLKQQKRSRLDIPLIAPIVNSNWIEIPNSPIKRTGMAITTYGNLIYLIGGTEESCVSGIIEMFDPVLLTYSQLADKPEPVKKVQTVQIRGKIIVPGGINNQNLTTDIVEVYDIMQNKWNSVSSLPKPLHSYAIAAYQGKVYIFGGNDGERLSNDVYEYDLDADQWEKIGQLPTPIMEASAVTTSDLIFLIGGKTDSGEIDTVLSFNPIAPRSKAWKTEAPLPTKGSNLGSGDFGDLLFVSYPGANKATNPSVVYMNSKGSTWIGNKPVYSKSENQPASTVLQGMFYIFGYTANNTIEPKALAYRVVYNVMLPITSNN